jgi:hypothetical protein
MREELSNLYFGVCGANFVLIFEGLRSLCSLRNFGYLFALFVKQEASAEAYRRIRFFSTK